MERMLKFFVLTVLLAALAAAQTPKSPTVKYWIQDVPNPDIKVIHTTHRFNDGRVNMSLLASPTELTVPQRQLLRLDGVEEVTLKGYTVSVNKGRAFYWNEVLPNVLKILEEHLGKMEARTPEIEKVPRATEPSTKT